jgi:predicted esterase
MHRLFFAALLICASAATADVAAPLNIDRDRVTVSGLSAGGQMAHQLHIAYSDVFSGAGLIAGGPFGCADGSLATAMARCIGKTDGPLPIAELVARIRAAASEGNVADTGNLADDRIWLFHGALDTIVAAEVSAAAGAIYAEFVPAGQIVSVSEVPAGHNFPTRGQGHACAASQPPFVGDCDYDTAGELLQYLYPDLKVPASETLPELQQVDLPGAAAAGLDNTAYLFVPTQCAAGEQACPLHLVLHGCAQSTGSVGMDFVEQSGYLPWAEANGIVLAFPQVVASAVNPLGCWDWWGYTGPDYLWRDGPQMKVLADWVMDMAANR